MNVLVTCGGSFQGLTVLKSLKSIPNVITHVADSSVDSIGRYFFDCYFQSPPISLGQQYTLSIEKYVEAQKIDFIFPASHMDIRILARMKEPFLDKYNCRVVVPDEPFIEEMITKTGNYKIFAEMALPYLEVFEPEDVERHLPVLAKPNEGWGGRGIIKIINTEQFIGLDIRNYHFVKFLREFREYSIDLAINQNGECAEPVLRSRDTVSSGFSTITSIESEYRNKFDHYIRKITGFFSKRHFFGVYNIQFLELASGEVFFSDLNCRMGTSAVASNYNNESLISHIVGKGRPYKQRDLRVIRYLDEKYIVKKDLTNVKGIVFDLDDTLMSQSDFVMARLKIFFERTDGITDTWDVFETKTSALLAEGKAPNLIDEISNIYGISSAKLTLLDTYRNCFPDELNFYPGTEFTLRKLQKIGYKLFVLTDNPVVTQKKKCELLGLDSFCQAIYYTNEWGLQKPDPLCFLRLAVENQLDPSELIMIGNNLYRDILGAVQAKYCFAFWLRSEDSLVSASQRKVLHDKLSNRFAEIEGISELFHFLPTDGINQ